MAGIKSSVFSKLCVLQTVTLQTNVLVYLFQALKASKQTSNKFVILCQGLQCGCLSKILNGFSKCFRNRSELFKVLLHFIYKEHLFVCGDYGFPVDITSESLFQLRNISNGLSYSKNFRSMYV